MVFFRARGKKTKYWEESSQETGKTLFKHSGDPPGDFVGHPVLIQGDTSRNARNNKNGKKENIMANLANMAKMTILPESPTRQSTKQ